VLLEINSGQIKLSGQVWSLSPLPNEFMENSECKIPREFYKILTKGINQNFDVE
jgi:hypothetical protein